MKRFFVLLIGLACAAAQAQQTPCLKLTKVKVADHVLHQNGVTRIELTFEGRHCYVSGGSLGLPYQRPVVDVESGRGLIAEFKYISASRLNETPVGLGVLRAQELSAILNVIATDGLDLGEHKLPGRIHYAVVDSQGNMSDETLNFEVPIKVAPPVKPPGPSFSERHPVWAKVLLPFEIIALFPLWILAGLISGESC